MGVGLVSRSRDGSRTRDENQNDGVQIRIGPVYRMKMSSAKGFRGLC